MNIQRLTKHLLSSHWHVRRAFPPSTMAAIAATIQAVEQDHDGEIRFAVESALEPWTLIRGLTPRERAIEVFSKLRVWDTQHNNGVLIYLLLADQDVEIVADRGIHAKVDSQEWEKICRKMETAFKQANYEEGVVSGIQAVTQHLVEHFPASGAGQNELPDKPVVL